MRTPIPEPPVAGAGVVVVPTVVVTVVVGPGTVVVTVSVWSEPVAVAVAQTERLSPPTVATGEPSTPTVWEGAVVVAQDSDVLVVVAATAIDAPTPNVASATRRMKRTSR
jgi:hypothetical protein